MAPFQVTANNLLEDLHLQLRLEKSFLATLKQLVEEREKIQSGEAKIADALTEIREKMESGTAEHRQLQVVINMMTCKYNLSVTVLRNLDNDIEQCNVKISQIELEIQQLSE